MRITYYLWLAVFAALSGYLLSALESTRIETSLLALLPSTHRDPVTERAWDGFADNIGKQILFLAGSKEKDDAIQAAEYLDKQLRLSGLFSSILFRIDPETGSALKNVYSPYHTGLLSKRDARLLQNNQGKLVYERALNTLYSPVSPVSADSLSQDPFLLFPEFLKHLPRQKAELGTKGELLINGKDGVTYILLLATLTGNPYSLHDQEIAGNAIHEINRQIGKAHPTVSILTTGALYYAQTASRDAKREISTIGVGSLVGIILLIMVVFRATLPLWASLVSIVFGFVLALSITMLVFPRIHLFTIVFGTSLIGVSVDYAFHFFATSLHRDNEGLKPARLRGILPAITLGLVTSVVAYAALAITEFPGLQQLALFSSTGLFGAYLTVVIVFPQFKPLKCPPHQPWLLKLTERQLQFWRRSGAKHMLLIMIPLLLFTVIGWQQLEIKDDIRLLQPPATDLRSQEAKIRQLTERSYSNHLLVVQAHDADAVLKKEERITEKLVAMEADAIDSFRALSDFVPSASRQLENRKLVKEKLLRPYLGPLSEHIGLPPETVNGILSEYTDDSPTLTLSQWLNSPVSRASGYLWVGNTASGAASLIILEGVKNGAALEELANSEAGVSYISKTDEFSAIFREHREKISRVIGAGYALIFVLLAIRYGLPTAALVMLPPAIASAAAVAINGWIGLPWNLFNVLALILVLGIGIDYTIFMAENHEHPSETMLAVWMSALTTMLSFGLLALSRTPAIHAFGVTVASGITVALLLAPLVTVSRRQTAGHIND